MSTPPLNQNESPSAGCLPETCSERKNEDFKCGSSIQDPVCHTTTTI